MIILLRSSVKLSVLNTLHQSLHQFTTLSSQLFSLSNAIKRKNTMTKYVLKIIVLVIPEESMIMLSNCTTQWCWNIWNYSRINFHKYYIECLWYMFFNAITYIHVYIYNYIYIYILFPDSNHYVVEAALLNVGLDVPVVFCTHSSGISMGSLTWKSLEKNLFSCGTY